MPTLSTNGTAADRVGLSVRPISNAHLYARNGGTENVILSDAHALGR